MTIQPQVRPEVGSSPTGPGTVPTYSRHGPRELKLSNDRRFDLIVVLSVLGIVGALGAGLVLWGPADLRGGGILFLGAAVFFAVLVWMRWWQPMMEERRIVRTGHYASGRIVHVACPWWSMALRALRPVMFAFSNTGLSLEAGYRLIIEVPSGRGGALRLKCLLWRTFAKSVPHAGQRVGVFFDPARDDNVVLAADLERLGVAVVEDTQR